MSLRLFILSVLLFPLGVFAAHPQGGSTGQKRLVFLGDSLTEGYGVARDAAFPSIVEQKIKKSGKNWTVVNAGVSGSTTASALSREKWIFKTKPDLLVLCLGANDGLRGLKVTESKKNLSDAIEYAQSQKVTVVLGGLYMPPNYGEKYTKEFHAMFEDLAKKYKVKLIPFLLEGVGGKSQYNQADGIHPNEKGHAIVGDHVYDAIKDLL